MDPYYSGVFLETGRTGEKAAGLKHILAGHADDFARRGIPPQDIPNVLMDAVEQGKVVGHQGRGTGRPIYEVAYNGETHHVAITIGSNGYIVGANPATVP